MPVQSNQNVVRAEIEAALVAGSHEIALAALKAGRATVAGDCAFLHSTLSNLRRAGFASEVLPLMMDASRSFPEHMGLRTEIARAHVQLGQSADAHRAYQNIIEREPKHPQVWTDAADASLAVNELDRALEMTGKALELRPGHADALRVSARILIAQGRDGEAIELLQELCSKHPDRLGASAMLAHALCRIGRLEDAAERFNKILETEPGNWPACRGLAMIAEAKGDLNGALQALGADLSGPSAGSSPRVAAQRQLQRARLAVRAGKPAVARWELDRLSSVLPSLDDKQLASVLHLANSQGHFALVADMIAHISTRDHISPALAQGILQIAHMSDEALAAATETALEALVDPEYRPRFRVAAARLRFGWDAALDAKRQVREAARTPNDARELARMLIKAGHVALARRYLRLCRRKWPKDIAFDLLYLNACCASGQIQEARNWLATMDRTGRENSVDALHLTLALETGQLGEALALMRRETDTMRRQAGDPKLLRVLIALGHLEEAESVAKALRESRGRSQKFAAHLGVQFTGQLLNELRQHRSASKDGGDEAAKKQRVRVATNFAAAHEVLESWVSKQKPSVGASQVSNVPRRIFQYWNRDSVPPAVSDIMQSWRSCPGWDYELLHRRAAIDWLRKTFGSRHARAFTMAKKPAEECDFLRLCLLFAYGGIYADADDRLIGSPEGLLSYGPGLIVFREPFGAIENNLICAPKGHPVLKRAMAMALKALLRRDNDMIWSKTGPGLLTRMVAVSIFDDREAAAETITVVPLVELGRHVQAHVELPYKSGVSHWIGSNRQKSTDTAITKALHELARMGQSA
ncbi:tetratricopeptide repeat protein [Primorskyibacter aestuariivivens]|uniref:tetratricopeptide repeat protein n=1 Tax=Primorskyibacter aestuariivivens TaxID=1888912 RepID=UPI002300E74C|nr:tetratricopeptide repeat protein [Primorskyibacter aestuariivivens]MDA7429591.1 tetratricopeptide repeat protein [Primorskyibacter aestuariivivens]